MGSGACGRVYRALRAVTGNGGGLAGADRFGCALRTADQQNPVELLRLNAGSDVGSHRSPALTLGLGPEVSNRRARTGRRHRMRVEAGGRGRAAWKEYARHAQRGLALDPGRALRHFSQSLPGLEKEAQVDALRPPADELQVAPRRPEGGHEQQHATREAEEAGGQLKRAPAGSSPVRSLRR